MCEVLVCVKRRNAKEPLHALENWDWVLYKPVPIQQQNILQHQPRSIMLHLILVTTFLGNQVLVNLC